MTYDSGTQHTEDYNLAFFISLFFSMLCLICFPFSYCSNPVYVESACTECNKSMFVSVHHNDGFMIRRESKSLLFIVVLSPPTLPYTFSFDQSNL